MILTSTFQADATVRCPDPLGDADELPPGFFGGMKADAHVRHHHFYQDYLS
jgi:hypothetical protein